MKLAIIGEGAIAQKHIEAIQMMPDVQITHIMGGVQETTQSTAEKYKIPHWGNDYAAICANKHIDAVLITSPTPIHALQAKQAMLAGKHVLIEIPMADNLRDSEDLVRTQENTGLCAMVCHTRRFNPSHQYLHQKIQAQEFNIQQLMVQTYFFRRTNVNALGQPRSWTDHLLWHHAAHSVDLFQYQTGEAIAEVHAMQGPMHDTLKIAMDMVLMMRTKSGKIANISLSFNNNGPLGTFFRYIGDQGTYIARYDDLVDGYDKPIDLSQTAVSNNGFYLQAREFFDAIKLGREPNASVRQILPTMQILHRAEQILQGG